MKSKSDCTILRWLDPAYASVVEEACDDHDRTYKSRLGLRLVGDLKWIARAAELSGRPIKSLCYGAFVMLFGWWLWYDFDERVKFWR